MAEITQAGEESQPTVPFWRPDTDINDENLPPGSRAVFEEWSGIAPADVLPHIRRCRKAAFAIHPYPCLGELRFLQFSIGRQASYARVVERLQAAPAADGAGAEESVPALLDIGCCVGQDLRKLAYDGVPSERLVGAELEGGFVELGYDLFRDREKYKGTFVVGDALQGGGVYDSLKGRFDIIHAASFLHLFSWEDQVKLATRMVGLLKDKLGVTVLGRQVGMVAAGEFSRSYDKRGARYLHNPESFQRMWDEVGGQTGTVWKVQATMEEVMLRAERAIGTFDSKLIMFEVTRVK